MNKPVEIPAIGEVSDPTQVRVVLFINGQFVHVPLKQLLKELNADNLVSGSINAALLANTDLNADNLVSGTVPDARISNTLTADKAYRRGNILGTVSESSGVPTGALMERGSNANGDYLRLADGTQLAWSRNLTAVQVATFAITTTWVFPASFVAASVVGTVMTKDAGASFSNLARTDLGSVRVQDNSTSSMEIGWAPITGVSLAANAQITSVRAMAVGRWF